MKDAVRVDTNTRTGGVGARLLGIGGDVQYQQDTVTVSLRAVSTRSGEILASVMIENNLASYGVRGGNFSFVDLDKLLEIEAGATMNEPRQVAVRSAVEKAVAALVLEGADMGVWQFRDRELGRDLIAAYRAEKYGDPQVASVAPPAVAAVTPDPTRSVRTIPVPRPRETAATPSPASAAEGTVGSEPPPAEPPPPTPDEPALGALSPNRTLATLYE
ncbi:CsgG/HfaB family protein [Salinarimonas ramus]|uniref:Curli production assembly/transport component CsgG n=1 Tax=Salinarimonas ramus TaxID=690164 RepID=A0A917QL14_9HYPH|nr:CsgG/HfaB family protein [Salinarimonas ramus]GGK55267.1 hypothetical protein GCM10011322_47420 [Salinarimonas ramus]